MEQIVSSGIVDSYFKKIKETLSVDVAIVGGGPSGLVAAYYLAKQGLNVTLYERKLAPGGGMWGGAMMFNEIVVQKEALDILGSSKLIILITRTITTRSIPYRQRLRLFIMPERQALEFSIAHRSKMLFFITIRYPELY